MSIKKKVIFTVVMFTAMIVLTKSGYQVRAETKENFRVEETSLASKTEQYVSPINFTELRSLNQDVIGWLIINKTIINYPIMYNGTDDYLHRDIHRESSYQGSIYVDRKSRNPFVDILTILYGHNMKNGSMFAAVDKFSDGHYWNQHQLVVIETEGRKRQYIPYLCVVGYSDGAIRNVNDRESLKNFCRDKKVTQGMIPDEFSNTIVLITCNYTGNDYRTYLFCRLME